MPAQTVATAFQRHFGYAASLLVRAPGRVNLIGEHTDYNLGYVLPAAIDKEIYFAVGLNSGSEIRLVSHDLNDCCTVAVDQLHRTDTQWANYLLGVAAQLQKRGVVLAGFDCVFGGNIPVGAGMSSSAAVECGLAFALDQLLGTHIDKMTLAHVAQKAEHEYAGVMCGLMDQFASLFGRPSQVVRLDCRSLEYEYFPFDTGACRIVLCNSGVKHSLADSEYNKRRQECERGVHILQQHYPEVKSLRDATLAQLEQHQAEFDAVTYRRCRYVVQENQRVLDACASLQRHDLAGFGQLMHASHAGLRDDYEVSCTELDVLEEAARGLPGVYGARMMGGGFGGCTINLVAPEQVDSFISTVSQAYQRRFGRELETYQTSIVGGVSEADINELPVVNKTAPAPEDCA
ncbi:galactokinase [Hymenobacter jeollabukensis]|uniref:Galactokinase n=1 Tax=Hymenobacter jeollabukensis TaxID=2025313 RepID=A0A5R8WUC7_9BACT|nr:galactokinase [Hymenobacter jeollabukensis]TLM95015.1 galactokinase [Hymenobacter jeollabukensis]